MILKTLLAEHEGNLALVIGNGINRYKATPGQNSWDQLLMTVGKKLLGAHETIPLGIALTEFYDLMDLGRTSKGPRLSLQQQFCSLLRDWSPQEHHKRITSWAARRGCPILTTNFDDVLGRASGSALRTIRENTLTPHRRRFTDYYPWENYYAAAELDGPTDGFGIWHINGMQRYHRSIRLGLSHYMGSVQRARSWLHQGGRRLSSGNHDEDWAGAASWLQILFCKPLLILGLGLNENEVFLRWLLIERARYFRMFAKKKQPAWFVEGGPIADGKVFFLKGVGVTPVQADGHDELYDEPTWA